MINEQVRKEKKVLGKLPARSHLKMLNMENFVDPDKIAPAAYNYWKGKKPFPSRSFGNTEYGDCTRASQALLAMRMERIEQRRTINISDEEVIRVYFEMSQKYYGGGDNGAFELDALNEWRRSESTFKDAKGRPFTIDAFVRINQADLNAVKNGIWLSGAHGIKVCFNLPIAWQDSLEWDIPDGQQPIGEYLPGGWGGHSMTAISYDKNWFLLVSSWDTPDIKISQRALSIFCDESYLCIDSINSWKKKKEIAKFIDLKNLKAAVNNASSLQIS